jgi:K+-transporting ATPase ATPase C chain
MRTFIRQLRPALIVVVVFTLICGVAYPLLTTAIGQAVFNDKANGSLITRGGVVVASKLIGQSFVAPQYFHPRPSAAGTGYDGSNSSGSNLGPTNPDLLRVVDERAKAYRAENGLGSNGLVPVDAVTASGSGLDPHISIANARLQAPRVAKARSLTIDQVQTLIREHTDGRGLAVLGEPGVNVVELNLALDQLHP